MQNAQTPSGPMPPWILRPFVLLLRWERERLTAVVERGLGAQHGSCDVCGALLLVAAVTLMAVLGGPLRLTMAAGVGLSVLFVVAHCWVAVQEQHAA